MLLITSLVPRSRDGPERKTHASCDSPVTSSVGASSASSSVSASSASSSVRSPVSETAVAVLLLLVVVLLHVSSPTGERPVELRDPIVEVGQGPRQLDADGAHAVGLEHLALGEASVELGPQRLAEPAAVDLPSQRL